MRIWTPALLVCFIAFAALPAHAQTSAKSIVVQSADAMGGTALLRSIHSVEDVYVGERQMVEQSERPTGPYLIDHFEVDEVRDLNTGNVWSQSQHWGYAGSQWWLQQTKPDTQTSILNGNVQALIGSDGKQQYAGASGVSLQRDTFAFAPERLLLTALAAPDLRRLPDVIDHGMRHDVVAFTWNGETCSLEINASTHLPWQLTYTHAYDDYIFYSAWGDVTTQLTFTGWSLEPNGLHYPREWTYRRLGLPDEQISIMQLHFNVPIDAVKMTVDPVILNSAPKGPRSISAIAFVGKRFQVTSIAPNFIQAQSSWNVEFVDQPDGVIVIEAPIAPNYAKGAFAFAFPHIAGVRQAVAEGIPVYALDLNLPILRRLIAAPHRFIADDLQRRPRAPQFIPVTGRTTIGSGASALEILPYRTVTADRQMMVYMPTAHLLYTSDLFQEMEMAVGSPRNT